MLDFVSIPPQEYSYPHIVDVKLIHETLATHLRRSQWHHLWLPKGAEHYFGPSAWAHISLDVFNCATKEEIFDAPTLRSELENSLKSHDMWVAHIERVFPDDGSDRSLAAISRYVRPQKWSDLSHLLRHCLLIGVELLRINHAVVEAKLELVRFVLLSAAMSLHLSICRRCYEPIYDYPLTMVRIQRLWKVGRLDLVFAAFHNLNPYLEHELDAAESQSNPIQDVFDLIVWHSGNPSSKISHALIERFAKRGFYVDGRHLCVIQVDPRSGVCDSLIACAQHTPADSWSGAHDEGCECYESSTTLLQHWCLPNYLGPHNHFSELLRLLVLAGEDVNGQCDPQGYPMETIFGTKMSFMTDPYAGEVLAWKVSRPHRAWRQTTTISSHGRCSKSCHRAETKMQGIQPYSWALEEENTLLCVRIPRRHDRCPQRLQKNRHLAGRKIGPSERKGRTVLKMISHRLRTTCRTSHKDLSTRRSMFASCSLPATSQIHFSLPTSN